MLISAYNANCMQLSVLSDEDKSMPNYDAQCSQCGHETTVMVKLCDLTIWDRDAICPICAAAGTFCRVIKHAPASAGTAKKRFANSGELSRMQENQRHRTNHQQIAAAKEIVKKGAFEDF